MLHGSKETCWQVVIYRRYLIDYSRNYIYITKQVRRRAVSFMYRNPTWTFNGFIVVGLGMTVCILGIIFRRLSSN